jgi:hypothetical protein
VRAHAPVRRQSDRSEAVGIDSKALQEGPSAPVNQRWDRLKAAKFAAERGPKGMARGTGAWGGYRAVFGRPKAESRRPVVAVRVDGTYVRRAGVSQQGLRRSLETIDGESPFVEDATFDNAWDSLRDGANALVQQPLRASLFLLNTEIGNHDRVLENRGGPSRSGDGSNPVRYRRHECVRFLSGATLLRCLQ